MPRASPPRDAGGLPRPQVGRPAVDTWREPRSTMYRTANQLVLSATDLVDYFFCEHLTQQELARATGLIERPQRDEAAAEVLRKRGTEHENRYLRFLLDSGRDVAVVPRPSNDLESL